METKKKRKNTLKIARLETWLQKPTSYFAFLPETLALVKSRTLLHFHQHVGNKKPKPDTMTQNTSTCYLLNTYRLTVSYQVIQHLLRDGFRASPTDFPKFWRIKNQNLLKNWIRLRQLLNFWDYNINYLIKIFYRYNKILFIS